jgi:hypothetical protein
VTLIPIFCKIKAEHNPLIPPPIIITLSKDIVDSPLTILQ